MFLLASIFFLDSRLEIRSFVPLCSYPASFLHFIYAVLSLKKGMHALHCEVADVIMFVFFLETNAETSGTNSSGNHSSLRACGKKWQPGRCKNISRKALYNMAMPHEPLYSLLHCKRNRIKIGLGKRLYNVGLTYLPCARGACLFYAEYL